MQNHSTGAETGIPHLRQNAWLKMSIALLACVPLTCAASGNCGPLLEIDCANSVVGAAEKPSAQQPQMAPLIAPNGASAAVKAAIADGVTTGFAIASGAAELNPLVTPTPMGLLALTGVKVAVVRYADKLPEREKRMVMKSSTAFWGGAAANNLMVLMAAPPPFPAIAGLAMAYFSWRRMASGYDEYDRQVALRAAPAPGISLAADIAAPEPGREVALAK